MPSRCGIRTSDRIKSGTCRGDLRKGHHAVAGLLNRIARLGQHLHQGLPDAGIVIDNENGRGHRAPPTGYGVQDGRSGAANR